MRQEMERRGKSFDINLPIAGAAIWAVLLLSACDRASTRAEAPDADRHSQFEAAPRAVPGAELPLAGEAPRAHPAPAREPLSDNAITGKVNIAILTDPGMRGADVSVNTDNGVVALTGVVESQEQAAIASAHAQRQDGVMRIDNHLSAVTR